VRDEFNNREELGGISNVDERDISNSGEDDHREAGQ
jgi:hypothetical protein